MLERISVRNFRRFKNVDIDGLRRINLITGRNNTGKSTLLEAIFLLGGSGNPQLALNGNLTRIMDPEEMPAFISETLWTPLFYELNTDDCLEISGRHSMIGDLSLTITLDRPATVEVPRHKGNGALMREGFGERQLTFAYTDPKVDRIDGRARETADKISFDRSSHYTAFTGAILKPGGGSIKHYASLLGRLRKQKRGDLLLEALRVVEPRLQGIEDNSSSGTPMIWVDIGLRELVPLPVMGEGMTHVARIVLAGAVGETRVLLVDEIENGLHHSVLQDVWRVVEKTAKLFDVQIFATTHSFECVQAAHSALGSDGFSFHRLEVVDGTTRCVTYNEDAIDGAILHNMEVR